MAERRVYVPPEEIHGDRVIIKGDQAHHLVSVLRKKPGDKIVIFDGEGAECAARILRIGRDLVVARVHRKEVHHKTGRPAVALYAAVPKGRRFDIIVEGATELGADSITPLLTARTLVKLEGDANIPTKLERWRRITVAAAKQCCRSTLPKLNSPADFSDAVQDLPEWAFPILSCSTDSTPIQDVLGDIASSYKEIRVYIGPEGGFSPEEIEVARGVGMRLASLGENILRTETAALASLAVINCFLACPARDSRDKDTVPVTDGEK